MDPQLLNFLKELNASNSREWFQANKEKYQVARKSFESFVEELIPKIRAFDAQIDLITAKDCVFRIYRDVRFSPDKSPYKTNMGAYIAKGGKKSPMAGYYVHFEPGASFLAGGIYMPQPDILKKIRQEVYYQFPEFLQLISNPGFISYFGKMDDPDKLKKPPKEFPPDFPGIEWLKLKSYTVMHSVGDEKVLSKDYSGYATEVFKMLHPLNVFFNKLFT